MNQIICLDSQVHVMLPYGGFQHHEFHTYGVELPKYLLRKYVEAPNIFHFQWTNRTTQHINRGMTWLHLLHLNRPSGMP